MFVDVCVSVCVCVCVWGGGVCVIGVIVYDTAASVQEGHSLEVQGGRRERCSFRAAVSELQGGERGGGGGEGEMLKNPVTKAINWRDKAHTWLNEQRLPWQQETALYGFSLYVPILRLSSRGCSRDGSLSKM